MEDKGSVIGNREVVSVVSTVSGLTLPNEYPSLSQDWRHVLHNPKSNAYAKLKSDLIALGEAIDKRNEERRFVNRDFHPDYTAISVFS